MGRQERVEFYRNNRDDSSLLGDQEAEDEELAENEGNGAEPLPEEQEDDLSQQCQEYYERRERLKELERQRLRRAANNGRDSKASRSKPLPYDNYGSFFGPSEPVVARRIIEDARAREEASRVAARAKEMSEQHRVSKGASSVSRSVSESRPVEPAKKSLNETALRLQRLKEARDYSFLFNDEDPGSTKKASEDNDRLRHKEVSGSGSTMAGTASKPGLPVSAKQGIKVAKGKVSTPQKGDLKLSRPPADRPLLSDRGKFSLQQPVVNSSHSKTTSGLVRPPQSRPTASTSTVMSTKHSVVSAPSAAQLKSVVASAPKAAINKQPLPNSFSNGTPGKMGPKKPVPASGLAKKPVPIPESKKQVSAARMDQKRPGVVTVARGGALKHQDQRWAGVSATSSKQVMKLPSKPSYDARRMQKWAHEPEFDDDSFLDDDDDDSGEGDVSSMIQKLFRYDPKKYVDIDNEDDRSMEADFHTIQQEEKRSARIGKEEDKRELALIEEEERLDRERARKKRKR